MLTALFTAAPCEYLTIRVPLRPLPFTVSNHTNSRLSANAGADEK